MAQPTTDPSLGLLCQRSMRRAFLSKMARRAGDGEDTSSRESGLGKGHVLISAGRVGGQDKPQFLSSRSFRSADSHVLSHGGQCDAASERGLCQVLGDGPMEVQKRGKPVSSRGTGLFTPRKRLRDGQSFFFVFFWPLTCHKEEGMIVQQMSPARCRRKRIHRRWGV